jgi:hypothetical protein
MKFILYSGDNSMVIVTPLGFRGGGSTVAKKISSTFNLHKKDVVAVSDIFFHLRNFRRLIFLGPTCLFYGLLFRIYSIITRRFFRQSIWLIFDHHPLGFLRVGLIKFFLYALMFICSMILVGKKNTIVPNGNLSKLPLFSLGRKIDWSVFIDMSNSKVAEVKNFHCMKDTFMYLGTFSAEKRSSFFNKLFAFENSVVYGYVENTIAVDASICYKGAYDNIKDLFRDFRVLVWTSVFESYGLTVAEWHRMSGRIVFLCEPSAGIFFSNSVTILNPSYSVDKIHVIKRLVKYAYVNNCELEFSDFFSNPTFYQLKCLFYQKFRDN